MVFAFGLLAIGQATPAAANTPVGGHTFNLCGSYCNGVQNPQAADLVIWYANADNPRPITIATQETCSDMHFWRIAANLNGVYLADFSTTNIQGGVCGLYGDALFVMGGDRGTAQPEKVEYYYSTQYNAPCTIFGGPECRVLLCRRTNTLLFGGLFTACTTHLDNHRGSETTSQRSEGLFIVNANYSNARVVGGDFNSPPGSMGIWTSGYWDVDPLARRTILNPTVEKIDWSLANMGSFPSTRITDTPYCNPYYSDHCYLRGYWILP